MIWSSRKREEEEEEDKTNNKSGSEGMLLYCCCYRDRIKVVISLMMCLLLESSHVNKFELLFNVLSKDFLECTLDRTQPAAKHIITKYKYSNFDNVALCTHKF